MSDFIYSKIKVNKDGFLTKAIQSIYEDKDKPNVIEYHGPWGSLAVSRNLYHGFEPYEDDEYIAIVIGGPLLMYQDNRFIRNTDSNEGTKSIYARWKQNKIKWDKDLNGPFAILFINKLSSEITFITDLMSFIPIYKLQTKDNFVISTHVDVLAKVSGERDRIDPVSQVDFILHGIVTYPYTIYKNIRQVTPATLHKYDNVTLRHIENSYWIPYEKHTDLSLDKVAIQLRQDLQNYINYITNETQNIAQFISGGEDSRTLSALLQPIKRDAFIFIDEMNLEGRIAKKVADIYGADLKVYTRHKYHYAHILPTCSNLVGSGSQYHHAHTYGFHKQCDLQSYDAVFGGLFSDALLKGARIKKVKHSGQLPFKREEKRTDISNADHIDSDLFSESILKLLTKRRREHLEYISSFRKESAEEWFELWPSSMNMNIPNIHANRRLFRSYEPFMSNDVVKLSAQIPQSWKLNRRLFHIMAKPLLKPSKWLRHGDGWFPYYSWHLRSITIPFVILKRKVERELLKTNKVHGPWGSWQAVVASNDWVKMKEKYKKGMNPLTAIIEKDKDLIDNNKLTILQQVNLVQVLYFNSKINGVEL